jgi:hypothetical protein
LRQELERKTLTLEQLRAAHDDALENVRGQLGKLHEDVARYKDQRDAALVALDALQVLRQLRGHIASCARSTRARARARVYAIQACSCSTLFIAWIRSRKKRGSRMSVPTVFPAISVPIFMFAVVNSAPVNEFLHTTRTDSVEREVEDIYAQRNAAIQQVYSFSSQSANAIVLQDVPHAQHVWMTGKSSARRKRADSREPGAATAGNSSAPGLY